MKCERCGKEDAVIKMTRIERSGQVLTICLCQPCAAEASPHQKKVAQKPSSIEELLKELLKSQKGSGAGAVVPADEEAQRLLVPPCPSCGLDFGIYKSTFMLGCPDCYEAFATYLEPDLKRLHRGATSHSGEKGTVDSELGLMQRQLEDMRQEQRQAVEYEDFERAAFLRDEIGALEKRIAKFLAGKGQPVQGATP